MQYKVDIGKLLEKLDMVKVEINTKMKPKSEKSHRNINNYCAYTCSLFSPIVYIIYYLLKSQGKEQ